MKKKLKMNLNWNFLRKLLFIACFSVSAVLTYAQGTKTVTGTALDENGKPLVGVNISVKGTQNRTLTDAGGNFSLSVTNQDVLVFSYIGFITQEKTVGTTTNFSIVMDEDSILLEDIVIVGYATVKKANLTGAVDQIDGRILADRPITSVAQALQGTIANLNISSNNDTGTAGGGAPGAKMSLNIRGVTGLSNGSEFTSSGPLFVIDGIQGGDINSVNPDDIASISVLKDAASAAIYGSNAPYGVVLITTKKGAKTGKPVLTYSTNVGWSSAINMPTMVNSVEWMKIMNDAQQNTKGINFLSAENMQRIQDYYDGKITTPTVVNAGRTGDQTWSSFDDFGNGLSNDNINWYDVYFRENASTQQHNVSLSGGSQNSTYYIGLGYNQKNGLLKYGDDTFNRYSLRANLSSDVTKWLTANVRSSYTVGITDRPSQTGNDNFLQQIAQRWPIIPLKNNDGRYSSNSNIDAYQYGGRNITTDNITVLTGELVAKPMKGWDITFNYTYKANNIANEKNTLHYTLYDAFDVPFYAPGWTSDGFSIYTRGKDELYRERTDDTQHTINAFTSYEWEKNGHYLKGMAGFAQEYVHYYKLTASSGAVTLYTTELPTFNTMYYTTNNQSIGETSKRTLTTRGTFGRINYGYKDRYLLELNGRYDGSSRYMKDVRFKFYPGLSGAWVVSQENFWGESLKSYVDFLKIRASYGSLGEQSGSEYYPFYPNLRATAATSSAESYKYSNWLFNGSRYSSLSFPGIVNPNLTWITSTTVDFGFDITTLKNRLSATFDWYRRSSDDVVGPAEQLPAVLGVAAPSKNNASLETKGFELTLRWRDQIEAIGLSYGIRGTLADSKSVVKKYPNATKAISTWYEGAVIGDIWGYVTDGYYTQAEQDAGIDQNIQGSATGPGKNWSVGDIKYRDLDGDGLITRGGNTVDDPGDRKIIGNNRPRYTYGITLDAEWKGFDVSAFFQGVGKRDAWIDAGGPGQFWGTQNSEWQANFLTIHLDRWTPETPNGYFPKYYLNNTTSGNAKNQVVQTKYLQDASYLRFKNLQIGYTIPARLLNKAGISKLRVYVSGENLATITDFVKTIDPEFATLSRGIGYPLQRTWSVGLNLNF